MPTYDYVCRACSHSFEAFQSITEALLKTCPSCGKRKLERLIGKGAGIVFKGSGFYETDYKRPASEAAANKAKAEGTAAARPDGGRPSGRDQEGGADRARPSETGTDAKPARSDPKASPGKDGAEGGGRADATDKASPKADRKAGGSPAPGRRPRQKSDD